MRKYLLPLMAVMFSYTAVSQNTDRCGAKQLIKQQIAVDPVYAKKIQDIQKNMGNYTRINVQRGKPGSITIPVAVHVLYYSALS